MSRKEISSDFPFESNYLEVKGSRMHYVDIGDSGAGDPILFLHGNPSSSYLWRNIMPYVAEHGRVIAPDLIGMGKSDKPDIPYRFHDHYAYLTDFIEQLGLKNITLVIHDWGSGLGFHYAHQNPENVKAIAFLEAMLRPLTYAGFEPKFRIAFKAMRAPVLGWLMVSVANMFVKQIVPQAIVRPMTAAEKEAYAAPFPTIKSRKPVHVWPCEIPIDGKPTDIYELMVAYGDWLQETDIPKLMFHAQPGGTITEEVAQWAMEYLPNLTSVDLGEGTHYLQEDHPHEIGEDLANWIEKL